MYPQNWYIYHYFLQVFILQLFQGVKKILLDIHFLKSWKTATKTRQNNAHSGIEKLPYYLKTQLMLLEHQI